MPQLLPLLATTPAPRTACETPADWLPVWQQAARDRWQRDRTQLAIGNEARRAAQACHAAGRAASLSA